MLDENVNLYVMGADGKPVMNNVYKINAAGQMLDANGVVTTNTATAVVVGQTPQMTQDGLIQAFTNPALFANGVGTVGQAGSVGTAANSRHDGRHHPGHGQPGRQRDRRVRYRTLQNNLLGLPLDLASLNIARGRDTGVAPLNLARNQLFSLSGEQQLKPYISWADSGAS